MNKSKLYQYKIVEISFEQNKLNNFPMERGIGHILSENQISDRIDDLRETLLEELYDVVNSDFLTDHQKKILLMRLMGKTQNEIADHLGITQSAVHKAMHGNIDYKNDKKRYGGIIKKLRKVCKNNKKIGDILNKIEEAKISSND
jgi:DNA-directed RNA polymerase specialized sigma subunit